METNSYSLCKVSYGGQYALHKPVFQKCLDCSKHEKANEIGRKTVSLRIKFEHKKTKSKYMSTFRSIPTPDVSQSIIRSLNGKVTLLTMIFAKKNFQIFLHFGDRDERT